jgi:acyl-coenzyme A thioesterase PaaI-like protein
MHPLTQSLRHDSSYTEGRPHLSMPAPLRANHLVAGPVLSGTERLTVPPYLFHSPGARHLIALMHLGTQVSGHPGFVHGGLMAVLFDEVFARCACPALPKGVAVTSNLNVDFRSPGLLGRLYVLQARTVQVEGRKAWVEGTLEMLPGWPDGRQQEEAGGEESSAVLVAEAKALFIEPKFADVSDSRTTSFFSQEC